MSIYYSEEHEWITVEGEIATLGITQHAADQLGEIVFVEMKEPGESFAKGDDIGVVESVKAASDIFAPVDGEITDVNEALAETPDALNETPEGESWLCKIKLSDASQLDALMDEAAYKAFIA